MGASGELCFGIQAAPGFDMHVLLRRAEHFIVVMSCETPKSLVSGRGIFKRAGVSCKLCFI